MTRGVLTLEELTLSLGMAIDVDECTSVGICAIEAGLAYVPMTCNRCTPDQVITLQRLVGHVRRTLALTGASLVHTPDDFMQVTDVNAGRR
ncbi:MAG TPA: hypothetical protein VGH54_21275 [Mycobacterium sp.]|jgi:hypothetical protein|uniref:hypothetical protein n=1 Tax=Mycobacterium sp. TaxID=1785 RepID=UPI002F3E852D